MIQVKNTRNDAGVTICGDFHDFEALYESLHTIVGDEWEWGAFEGARLRVLGICYDIRHAIIKLEDVVEGYQYGYPTLIDGAETAPPEDVGGLPGYYQFLKVYDDEKCPEHDEVRDWAKEQKFREYDVDHTNKMLKFIKYKKNERS